MTGATFQAAWLSLREPADHRARSSALARHFLAACAGAGPIADLGAGTGSNARYLQTVSPVPLRWRLIDRDADLLARAGRIGAGIEPYATDLVRMAPRTLDGVGGVTAAALLDLVSEGWLQMLAESCAQQEVPALFALNVDGFVRFDPEDPDDTLILAGFARDQDRDKGFGPALGPAAPDCTERLFVASGFAVQCARSEWVISGDDDALLRTYLKGVAAAAASGSAPSERERVDAWLQRRLAAAAGRGLTVTVGHKDVLAVLPQA